MELADTWSRMCPPGSAGVQASVHKEYLREFRMQRGTRIAKPFRKDRMRLDTASLIRMLQEAARALATHGSGC